MTDPGSSTDPHSTDSRKTPQKTPLWVKGFIVAAAVIVVVFLVIHLSGGMVMNHTP
ncbi:hypothetical protein NG819_15945 [Pseudarthrobacter sp. Fe7]|nr:hypothetical protein NG819_15945 [Pseudarthrobacter sp. Fe7]